MEVLSGIKIIEIEGIGPAPFCGMHLADLGADVVVVERTGIPSYGDNGDKTITKRGKRVVKLNLKDPTDKQQLLELISHADGLIEGMRPGVMERLGLGPDICHIINPRLAYGRVTGWGQTPAHFLTPLAMISTTMPSQAHFGTPAVPVIRRLQRRH